MKSLELSGGVGKSSISLSGFSFKSSDNSLKAAPVRSVVSSSSDGVRSDVHELAKTEEDTSGTASGSMASIAPAGEGGNDLDRGKLFSQIKVFFESRLGSTLNVDLEQLIKIKIILAPNGEVLSAALVQGHLDFQALTKILKVAKSIPLNSLWKSSAPFPEELIIPIILTPN